MKNNSKFLYDSLTGKFRSFTSAKIITMSELTHNKVFEMYIVSIFPEYFVH